jgi:hypothetical protein
MATSVKYFNVKTGLTTGNITLDAATANANVGNISVQGLVSATDLNLSGNLNSNLVPNVATGVPSVINLGSSLQRFNNAFFSGNVSIGPQTLSANTNSAIFSANVYIPSALTANVIIANVANLTNANVSGTLTSNTINVDTITVNTQFTLNSSTNATSTVTGSFTTLGGVGIQQDLYVGGAIHLANANGGTTSKVALIYNSSDDGLDFNFNS